MQKYFLAQKYTLLITTLLFGVFFVSGAQAVQLSLSPEIRIFDTHFSQVNQFYGFTEAFQGGASVATGDVNGDGKDEIIVGAGPGGGPNVQVFTSEGVKLSSFYAYMDAFRKGIYVASCDLNNDGIAEIVTGPRRGGGPNVKVYTMEGEELSSFMAYDSAFRGGVTVACGDLNGSGTGMIITASGFDSGNQARLFSLDGEYQGLDFWPFAKYERGGLSVATADVNGDGDDEILFALHRFGHAWVKVYDVAPDRPIISEFIAFPLAFRGGVNIAGADLDFDGRDELLVAANGNGGPHVRAFTAQGEYLRDFFAYSGDFRGGLFIAAGDIDADGEDEIVTGPNRLVVASVDQVGKRIVVDLSEQRLYAYDDGVLQNSFLISSGVARYPSPKGEFAIYRKVPVMDYEWTYGPQHPDNYDIKDVKWNLNFTPHYYLHTAYWHNNFGHPMSHGCINISESNAKWVYEWAPIGTKVVVQD
ncbi:MAG: L,D-transpeptidase family protein [Candidatus Nomurabacteria bacterium]|nr:MAG: L,D-transpeptidase family protein [Candidatus Nomurabacteria bacterium]